jgi:hypothetical protein
MDKDHILPGCAKLHIRDPHAKREQHFVLMLVAIVVRVEEPVDVVGDLRRYLFPDLRAFEMSVHPARGQLRRLVSIMTRRSRNFFQILMNLKVALILTNN